MNLHNSKRSDYSLLFIYNKYMTKKKSFLEQSA